jgi:hypothetical protein
MSKPQHKSGSDPRCWWCHEPIPLGNEWRGNAPELDLPVGVGVHICGPQCPNAPDGAITYTPGMVKGL